MANKRLTSARWLVFWGLAAHLGLGWVAPAIDHHAGDHSPHHAHVIVGTAGPAERARLLAEHDHGGAAPHHHGLEAAWAAVSSTEPTIRPAGSLLAALRAGVGAPVLARLHWPPALPAAALWLALVLAAPIAFTRSLSPPEQPPRLARILGRAPAPA